MAETKPKPDVRERPFVRKVNGRFNIGCGLLWCLIMVVACTLSTTGTSCSEILGNYNLGRQNLYSYVDQKDFARLPEFYNFYDFVWENEENDLSFNEGEYKRTKIENFYKIQVPAVINNQTFSALIDTGSTHSYINLKMAKYLQEIGNFGKVCSNFNIADGSSCSSRQVYEFEHWVDGQKKRLKVHLFDELEDEILIGMDSLKSWNTWIDPVAESSIYKSEISDPEMLRKHPKIRNIQGSFGFSSNFCEAGKIDNTGEMTSVPVKQTKDPPSQRTFSQTEWRFFFNNKSQTTNFFDIE